MLRISNVKVALGKDDYRKAISQELNVREKYIQHVQLDKLSIDARRGKVHFICSFLFEVENEEEFLKKHPRVQKYKPYHYTYPKKDNQKVVIVGSGPAGLFCGYVLSKIGQDVTIVERGQQVEKRIEAVDEMMKTGKINPQSNISFGEGGAGTFSDGKLTTGIKNHRLRYILETFVHHGRYYWLFCCRFSRSSSAMAQWRAAMSGISSLIKVSPKRSWAVAWPGFCFTALAKSESAES